MTDRINERILDTLREKTQKDELIGKFLEELLFVESENPGWFKELYRQKIEKYAEKWSGEK